ncbi:hypothetical protein LCGC14_1021460 [marine sediment metagenome]|uniref:Uncharacterized protein n=1 Tax=marine sediment metagenome TaxID=412755 RepID=A0A0F9MXD2_9ZZZZ
MIVGSELESELENCGICHKSFKQGTAIHHGGPYLGVICPQCYSKNSEKDIELIANMFMVFGGYFGILRDPRFPVNEMIKCLLKEIQTNKGIIPLESLKINLFHLALLHGFTPEEFNMLDNDLLKHRYFT